MTIKDFIGTWKLVSFDVFLKDGQKHKSWGKKTHGTLIYSEDGFMSAAINGESARESVFYSGKFELRKDGVMVHHVTEAHRPIRIGTLQERRATLKGDQLILEAVGPRSRALIKWEKAKQ